MSLTQAQVQFLVSAEPFRSRLAETARLIHALYDDLPVSVRQSLWSLRQDRTRCRTITRRKQRRSW